MAENKEGQEKSEEPTGKRLEQARRKGQVATTRELAPVMVLVGGVGMLTLWAPTAWRHFQHHSQSWLERAGTLQMNPEAAYALVMNVAENVFLPFLLFPLVMAGLGAAALLLQTGPLWIEDALKPKFSKLNPMNGIKKILSLRGVVDLLKSLLKLGVVTGIVYAVVSHEIQKVLRLSMVSVGDAISDIWGIALKVILWVASVLFVMAIADFLYQRWQQNRDLKMTKQETKDESKDVEGDPQIRSRRLSLQIERSRQRMMQAVPNADVVITNPTHVAVALKYEAGSMAAPSVVAKGAGVLAEKIKQIARHAGVPIIENRGLARGLYRIAKVGQEIPADLYRAAAEVLAYVYRLRQEREKAS